MHLLYIDESGAVTDPNQSHFILAGISVFERKTHWIEQRLNNIAERFDPVHPHEIELHGSPMRSGREGWKRFKLIDRLKAIVMLYMMVLLAIIYPLFDSLVQS